MNFIIPFVYLFNSRLHLRVERISWVFINPIVLFLATWLLSNLPLGEHILLFLLAFLVWQSLYEIGYIYNDVFTTKNEVDPTLRLGERGASFIERRFALIVTFRSAISALAFLGIVWLDQYKNLNLHVLWFLGVLGLSCIAFVAHNSIRNRLNIITFGVLSATKYSALPLLMVAEGQEVVGLLVSLTMFPLVRTLEHATKKKYLVGWLKKIVGVFPLFRIKYYVVALSFACVAYWLIDDDKVIVFISIYSYFLVYRVGVWFVVRKNIIRQTVHRSY